MPDCDTTSSRCGPPTDAVVTATAVVQQRLRASSYPALRDVQCELIAGALVLRGRVSSFYFKQLAQEVARKADGGQAIVNELDVEYRSRSAVWGGPEANRSTKEAH